MFQGISMEFHERISLRIVFLVGVTLAFCGSNAAHGTERTFSVRSAAPILSCGGFSPHCLVSTLSGSLTMDIQEDAIAIVRSDLRLRHETSPGSQPFPGGPDLLQLTELSGRLFPDQAVFESPEDSFQDVELVFQAIGLGAVLADSELLLLRGHYDEGCCDRFDHELGNVVLVESGAPGLVFESAGQRFVVTATWRDFAGNEGVGSAVPLDGRSGLFWFFAPDNPELVVKVLDACARFGRVWVFATGLTDVEVALTVRSPGTGHEQTYRNELGEPFGPVLDTQAFPCPSP